MTTKDEALKLALEALVGSRTFLKSDTPVEVWEMNTIAINECVKVLAQPDPSAYWHSEFLKYNTTSEQPAQQQEPVAKKHEPTIDLDKYAGTYGGYTTPPSSSVNSIKSSNTLDAHRKPLTDEEIWDEVKAADLDWQTGWSLDEDASNRYITFARAIEAAHGIKE